jgi:hypothetical protein
MGSRGIGYDMCPESEIILQSLMNDQFYQLVPIIIIIISYNYGNDEAYQVIHHII